MIIQVRENDERVSGKMTIEKILNMNQMAGKVGLFARCTVEPGSELHFHKHEGESETYFILSGTGEYNDDHRRVPAKAGDTFFCGDGHGHGIKNTGDEPLVFMALIINLA